ncbi:MAG: ABATE domain-containing protein [Thermoanaerobaculia bacterium]
MSKKDPTAPGVAREVEQSGALCLAFANSAAPRTDGRRSAKADLWLPLRGYDDLVVWGQRTGILGAFDGERLTRAAAVHPDRAAVVFGRGFELRAALLRIFTALAAGRQPRPKDLEILNGVLAESLPARRVVPGTDGFRWDWGGDGDALDRVLWPVVHSAGDLLTSADHRLLRQCAGSGCRRLFIGRNRRRLWCDMNVCGSRSKRRRHRSPV